MNPKILWLYFRAGHGQYLTYILSMTSFILIVYRLLIEQISIFEIIFPSLLIFVAIFIPIYIPLAIFIGKTHYLTQLETDLIEGNKHNPEIQKILRDLDEIKKLLHNFGE